MVRPVARSERDDTYDHRRVLRNGIVRYTAERFDRGEFEVDEHVSGQVQLWDGAAFGFTAQNADPWLFWILASLRPL